MVGPIMWRRLSLARPCYGPSSGKSTHCEAKIATPSARRNCQQIGASPRKSGNTEKPRPERLDVKRYLVSHWEQDSAQRERCYETFAAQLGPPSPCLVQSSGRCARIDARTKIRPEVLCHAIAGRIQTGIRSERSGRACGGSLSFAEDSAGQDW